MRIAEIDLDAGIDLEALMLSHFRALIPGQRAAQFLGQGDDGARDRVADSLGAMTGKRRPILLARAIAVARKAGEMQQHRKPRGALDQRADRRAGKAQDEIAFPVPRHRPVSCFGGTLADHDRW